MFRQAAHRARILSAYARGETALSTGPTELAVEITNHCTLACAMCPRPAMRRLVGFMDLALFRQLVDDLPSLELVDISGGLGDPLIHPDLGAMVAHCRSRGVRTVVSTSAVLLDGERAETLLTSQPDILLLCLDGNSAETHEAIRVKSRWPETLANVEGYLRQKSGRGASHTHAIVQMIHMASNAAEAHAFVQRWRHVPGVDGVRIKQLFQLKGSTTFVPSAAEDRRKCVLPWLQLSVSYTGEVALCCFDLDFSESLGNVRDRPVLEIWNGAPMQQRRRALAARQKGRLGVCGSCSNPIHVGPINGLGVLLFDDYQMRRVLPWVERALRLVGRTPTG